MINFDNYVNENKTKHNKNWPYIPGHPYKILIIGGLGSGKTNLLLNLIENQPDIDKIALSSNDDKRLQTYDRIQTYPYGTYAFKVCESEMLILKRLILGKIIIKINMCCSQRIKND